MVGKSFCEVSWPTGSKRKHPIFESWTRVQKTFVGTPTNDTASAKMPFVFIAPILLSFSTIFKHFVEWHYVHFMLILVWEALVANRCMPHQLLCEWHPLTTTTRRLRRLCANCQGIGGQCRRCLSTDFNKENKRIRVVMEEQGNHNSRRTLCSCVASDCQWQWRGNGRYWIQCQCLSNE